MVSQHPVSDSDRRKVEAALAAALYLIYRKHYESTLTNLGATPGVGAVTGAAHTRISIFAHKRAQLVQSGINDHHAAALAAEEHQLGRPLTPAEITRLDGDQLAGIEDYNDKTLIPYLSSWGANQGLLDGELHVTDPATLKPAAYSHDWIWAQLTDYQDDCTDAAGASPAPLDTLLSITGSMPPVHENCFVVGTEVAGPLVEAGFARPYQGPIVTIRTARGYELSGTPNHPVLTPEGWVPLGQLRKGQNVLSCKRPEIMAPAIDPDEHQVVARIEDIHAALTVPLRHMPVSAADFHGDGSNGNVNVVLADRSLQDNRHAGGSTQHFVEGNPGGTGSRGFRLPRPSATLQRGSFPPTAANGSVSSLGKGRPLPRRHSPQARALRRSVAAWRDSAILDPESQGVAADPGLLRQRLLGLPGDIAIDKIVEIWNVETTSCDVYNLSTAEAWYSANHIIVSNCQCLIYPAGGFAFSQGGITMPDNTAGFAADDADQSTIREAFSTFLASIFKQDAPAGFATTNSAGLGPSCFLVVEDPSKPTTWHLQVKDKDGSPNHGLMGAAWAALHGGYRGNTYQGPQKAQALSKLTALYKSEKMPLPTAGHSAGDAPFVAEATFSGAVVEDSGWVTTTGKLFEAGDYPDKQFSLTEAEMDAAVAAFTPADLDVGDAHVATVLEGKLGRVERIWREGKNLMGEVGIPAWLNSVLTPEDRKVSTEWSRDNKRLTRLCLVKTPRVTDAALMAAFSLSAVGVGERIDARQYKALDAFFAAAHTTPTGQAAIQDLHDYAVTRGAVCKTPSQASMASQGEADAIQAIHDIAANRGATCEAIQPGTTSSRRYFSGRAGQPAKETPMSNFLTWLTGAATKDGVVIDPETEKALQAAFSAQPSDQGAGKTDPPAQPATPASSPEAEALRAELAKRDEQLAAFSRKADAHEKALATMAAEKRHAESITFAQNQLQKKRVVAGSVEALAALTEHIAAADSVVTFAEGQKSGLDLLVAFTDSLQDLSIFTTDHIKPESVAALFNQGQTAGATGDESAKDVAAVAAKYPGLLETPLGRTIKADLAKAAGSTGGQS